VGTQSLDMITISVGIAHMPEHGTTEKELLRAADDALYSAKNSGRDHIVVYEIASPTS
jgi:diguanylate cyclase (GGDEF)-like protein